MDHHTVAAISITGTCLDVLGSLYLAYDLLGGQHGPLRLLTRAVTYSIVFGIGYGLGLGLFFGLASGITTGITLSVEFNRAARGLDHYSLAWEGVFSAIRGVGFGAGLYRILGLRFALALAILITVGQILAYSRGMRPAMEYVAARRPRLTRRQFWGTVVRTFGYIASALICSAFIHHVDHAWSFAIRVGLVTGIVTGIGATVNPYIEYYADNLPERRLGAFGIGRFRIAVPSVLAGAIRCTPHLGSDERMSDLGFPEHFDGRRFYNPAPQDVWRSAGCALNSLGVCEPARWGVLVVCFAAHVPRGFLDVLRWKLRSHPEPSPTFISDIQQSAPTRCTEGGELRVTLGEPLAM